MKTSIIYNSHSGTTKAYAEEIGNFFSGNGIECKISSIDDYDKEYLLSSDLVMLGCWTNGLMIFAQHQTAHGKSLWKKCLSSERKHLLCLLPIKLPQGVCSERWKKYSQTNPIGLKRY